MRQNTETQPPLELITSLCIELESAGIIYCHWKSNAFLDRSASGENDLDLLIDRSCRQDFTAILLRMGFKQFFDYPEWQMPGVLDFYGYDCQSQKFVHVHAHYQLVFGHDATKNYHIPIERAFLESVVQDDLFKVPAHEFELILLVIRLMIKHSTWDVIMLGNGILSTTERNELIYLQARVSQSKLNEILETILPYVDNALFAQCVQALNPKSSLIFRIQVGETLRCRLKAHARRPKLADVLVKIWRRLENGVQRRVFGYSPKKRMANGGLLVAIVGGDGSGKTTAVTSLYESFSEEFEIMKVHMGKPSWSKTTIIVRSILKVGRSLHLYPFTKVGSEPTLYTASPVFPGYPWLIREVCEARDRYLTYSQVRRFATNGGLVICDRFPLPEIKIMDGPQVERVTRNFGENFLIRILTRLEKSYYEQIMTPDLLIVLKANPEISVERKTDESPASVWARSSEIWNLDWSTSSAHVIDASRPKPDVLSDLKALVWSNL